MTHFTKSHGLGNDYLVVDPAALPVELTAERIRLLCDRHRGLGGDGILVLDGERGVRIFNPDGSEAEKSGNGIRIFAKWLYERGRTRGERSFVLETRGGPVPVEVEVEADRVRQVTANMGVPRFREELNELEVDGQRLAVVALSLGNPHCVVMRSELDVGELRWLGPRIERHPAFGAERTNLQLARPVSRGRVEALIWERGAGETLASGSSACAVAAACHRLGRVDREVTVSMPGGELRIRLDDEASGAVWMRGPVEEVAELTLSPELVDRLRALPSPA